MVSKQIINMQTYFVNSKLKETWQVTVTKLQTHACKHECTSVFRFQIIVMRMVLISHKKAYSPELGQIQLHPFCSWQWKKFLKNLPTFFRGQPYQWTDIWHLSPGNWFKNASKSVWLYICFSIFPSTPHCLSNDLPL